MILNEICEVMINDNNDSNKWSNEKMINDNNEEIMKWNEN